eukprot:TRINITY_DN11484_c0_g1_i1.p1 TRINITY_DN11484_c0_g1~~TRINITY_DN11484_c0_g1_i1.p1  ORF type:complete len:149 (-),score=27.55 TRINITY_DN11484_c0_g1_i1:10-456(-)
MSEPVYFCEAEGPYACFSNYYQVNINIDGKIWPSTEHWFQSQKFSSPEYQEEIRTTKSPTEAKKLGYARRPDYNKQWEKVKDGVMKKGLEAKFTQHEDLKKILLDSGERPIVERNDADAYWGDGSDRKGKNRLGILLQEVRSSLKEKK